jgi:hypothetical protein
MRPLVVLAHGILTRQTVASWPDQFHAWLERNGVNATVLKKEYIAGPLPLFNVHVKNRLLARGLAAEIELFCNSDSAQDDPPLYFIAHSNGTDVALKTIKRLAASGIDTHTFIAVGAVLKGDIVNNGITELLAQGHLQRAVAYSSHSDLAIRLGRHSLGYGGCGRSGWTINDDPVPWVRGSTDVHTPTVVGDGQIWTRRFDALGHGEYFSGEHRERTFQLFRKDCGL